MQTYRIVYQVTETYELRTEAETPLAAACIARNCSDEDSKRIDCEVGEVFEVYDGEQITEVYRTDIDNVEWSDDNENDD